MGSTCRGPGLGAQNPAALVPALLGGGRHGAGQQLQQMGKRSAQPGPWASSGPSRAPSPLALLLLTHTKFIPASGPLHLLFPRPGTGSPQIASGLCSPSIRGRLLSYHLREAFLAHPLVRYSCPLQAPDSPVPACGQSHRNASHRGRLQFFIATFQKYRETGKLNFNGILFNPVYLKYHFNMESI